MISWAGLNVQEVKLSYQQSSREVKNRWNTTLYSYSRINIE